MKNDLVIYDAEEGEVVFDFDREKETVWADVEQIASLFGVQRPAIVKHLKNIYSDGELEEERTCSKMEHMVNGRVYQRKLYNLDAIISVGYRVNSKKATKFRVWATGVLKKYIVNGAAVNERRIKELPEKKLAELEATLGMVKRLVEKTELEEGEAKGILEVISRYGMAIETIKEFDQGRIPRFLSSTQRMRRNLTVGDVKNLAENLREELDEGREFGELKDEEDFRGFLDKIGTDEGGKTVAEKAARLLYFTVNEEPFLQGNNRIGALLFIYFLTINDFHLSENGETKISDRALTAIVLLISESKADEKELIVGVVRKLLEG